MRFALTLAMLSWLPSVARAQPEPPAHEEVPAETAPNQNEVDARQHFERGLELVKQRAFGPALVEFLTSRRLFPTAVATKNAAVCMRELERYDEALSLFEELLATNPDLAPDQRAMVDREIAILRGLMGAVALRGGEREASVQVDGVDRGRLPLEQPLRVAAGLRTLRIYKRGFAPFVQRVEVAAGKTSTVTVTLDPLLASGQLRVLEQSSAEATVAVDGVVVGRTPWEGPLSTGNHIVVLSGAGEMGTQPVSVRVRTGQLSQLRLALERLSAELRVRPAPPSANVAINGERVGSGVWRGRLRAGGHLLEVTKEGFVAVSTKLSLAEGETKLLDIELERDPDSPVWGRPSRVTLEGDVAFAISPTLGGSRIDNCGDTCSTVPALGGLALARVGYQLGIGVGFGLEGGLLILLESVADRSAELRPNNIQEPNVGTMDEDVDYTAGVIGASFGYRIGETYPVTVRLSAGAVLGRLRDRRNGTFTATRPGPQASYDIDVGESNLASYVYVAPEVRVSFPIGDALELGIGVRAMVLIAPSPNVWENETPITTQSDGLAKFADNDSLVGTWSILVVPGLGLRYAF